MAMKIILVYDEEKQEEIEINNEIHDQDWEEDIQRIGCMVSKTLAKHYLEEKDTQLLNERPRNLRTKDSHKRTLVTRFGDITFHRRYYQDEHGTYHYLLDEYLNWRSYQPATPSLTEALVDSATRNTFRRVSDEVEKYTAGVLSKSTVHRLLQRITQSAIDQEKEDWRSCFEDGSLSPPGQGKSCVLYTEADGIWVHLQQEEQEHYELKNAIAYEGWESISGEGERYRLLGKKIYSHSDDSIPFWDGAGLEWHKWWNLEYTNLIVVGGDDASWVDSGTDELGYSVRQLDAFHLSRACHKGWENGDIMYEAVRSGRVRQNLGNLKEREGKTAEKSRKYVLERLEKGIDWREKIVDYELTEGFQIPEDARGLGAIEGNESNLYSDRMKDRGMSWTIRGAQHMGKAIQLAFNGELADWCGRVPPVSRKPHVPISLDLFDELDGNGERTAFPACQGPHPSKPWVKALKDISFPHCP